MEGYGGVTAIGRPPTAVREILSVLEPYLEARMSEYRSRPEPRDPTLPSKPGGKINVRDVVRQIGLKVNQEQHFYRHAELTNVLNAAAQTQGLGTVGSRAEQNADDDVVVRSLARARKDAADLARNLAEREALIQRLRERIGSLEEELRLRDETGMVVRSGPLV